MKRLLFTLVLLGLIAAPLASAGTVFSFQQQGPSNWPIGGTTYASLNSNGWSHTYYGTPYRQSFKSRDGAYGGFSARVDLARPITTTYTTRTAGNWQLQSASIYNQGRYGAGTTRLPNGNYYASGSFGSPSYRGYAYRPAPTYGYQRSYGYPVTDSAAIMR